MFELLLCSSLTVLPDFLIRRFVQGKRIGHEITLFSVWYELRWGLTACVILTLTLITIVFYYHPSTRDVTSFYRTVTILPEAGGRVDEVYVVTNQDVEAGTPLFQLDDSQQRASLEAAQAKLAEVQAAQAVSLEQLEAAEGQITQAEGSLREAQDELDTRAELRSRNADIVSPREIERLEAVVDSRQGTVDAAISNRDAVQAEIDTLLPAQLAEARARLEEAQVAVDKTQVTAGVSGRVEQFALQVGDFVSPLLRPAGILVPEESSDGRFVAGFNQISAQVLQPGMVAEISCASLPFKVVPMVVAEVQDVIAGGQFRPTDQIQDVATVASASGTLTVVLEPLYPGVTDRIPAGSTCVANAYTNNHDRLDDPEIGTGEYLFLHLVDTVGLVHALLLRIQTMLLPVQTLVLTGH